MLELQEKTEEVEERPERQTIEAEMRRILEGPSFRSSPRCRQFLKFVVNCALEGRHDLLKERTIGIEVFGRDPAYVTEADSIVRVRASEVRRRLLQHYSASPQEHSCRIEIQSGSYVPQFRMTAPIVSDAEALASLPEPSSETSFPDHKHRIAFWLFWMSAAIAMITVLLFLFFKPSWSFKRNSIDAVSDHNEKALEEFWMPAIRDSKPVLLCIGSPTTYTFTGKYHDDLERNIAEQYAGGSGEKTVPAQGTSIPANHIFPVRTEFVGAGDANLAVLLSAFFSHYGKVTEFELSDSTSYGQISDAPTVLIGAFTNRWTLASTAKLPFTFVEQNNVRMIQENDGKRRQWTNAHLQVDGKTDEDFAIVTRLSNSDTGKFLVTAAGISGFGSRAAGYFLSRPALLANALNGAPADWPQKNLQFVLVTRIVDNAPTAPTVVARRIW